MTNDTKPTISRMLSDGTIIELLYDADTSSTALAISEPDQIARVAPDYVLPDGGRAVPYSPSNTLIANGCVLLPSAIGEHGEKGDLVDEVRRYLHRYVDLAPTFEAVAAYYVLLSWVYDAFNELPYLRFRGDFGTGKTRALITIGSICYKPFFASGASTVSPIFHILDTFGGTLVLDEADFRFSDATAELTKILNNGNVRGLPVLRTMTNRNRELNPTAFRIFGPKIMGMRERFSDRALESRFLTEETGTRPLRSDIPIHMPNSLAAEARGLRNKLLAWRFAARREVASNPSRLISGVSPRLNQTALSLLSLIDDERLREDVAGHLLGEERENMEARRGSDEARIAWAIESAFRELASPVVPISEVASRFNKTLESFQFPLTNRSVGALVRRLGIHTKKSHGIYVIPQSERQKIKQLHIRLGIGDLADDVLDGSPDSVTHNPYPSATVVPLEL